MKLRSFHRGTALTALLICGSAADASAAVTLNGAASDATSILWTWTPVAGLTFDLVDSAGAIIIPAISGGSTTEGTLPTNTAIQRRLQQTGDPTNHSELVTVATPDKSVVVPPGSPATLVGSDTLTRAALPKDALPAAGQASVSADPVHKPITSSAAGLIAAANTKLSASRVAVTASFREFTAIAGGDLFTGTFTTPVSIQIPYLDANNSGIVDGVTPAVHLETLSLFTIDPALGQWVPVPGATLDRTNKVFNANVTHFSVYGLFGAVSSGDLNSLRAFPNPWRPGSGGAFDDAPGIHGIHFKGLTATATIKIFTITGDIVRRLDKSVDDGDEKIWDGLNDDGRKAASGIYLYVVTNPDTQQQKTGRIGIIR